MDVYVLTENGHVLGAGTDRSVCADIADRRGDKWSPWVDAGGGVWERRAVIVRVFMQRITRVPLAGIVTGDQLSPSLRQALQDEMPAVTYVGSTMPTDAPAVDPFSQAYADRSRLADRLNETWRRQVTERLAEIEEIGRQFGAP